MVELLMASGFFFKKVSDLDVVGVIPEELWSLTFFFNLYDFFFIFLFTCVLHQYRLPSFSYELGLNLNFENVVH